MSYPEPLSRKEALAVVLASAILIVLLLWFA